MASSADILSQLQSQQSQMLSPQQILQQQEQQYGTAGAQQNVQGLRSAIQNTTNLLNQVAPSVMGRTGNSLVTSAQANRQIQNEQTPIQGQLSDLGGKYQNAESDYQNLEGKALQAAQLQSQGQDRQMSYLESLYNDLYKQEQDAKAFQLEQQKMAEQTREFNATPHGSGGGAASRAESRQSAVNSDIQAAYDYAKSNPNAIHPYYREQVAQQIASAYGIPIQEATKQVMLYFPNGWESRAVKGYDYSRK